MSLMCSCRSVCSDVWALVHSLELACAFFFFLKYIFSKKLNNLNECILRPHASAKVSSQRGCGMGCFRSQVNFAHQLV